MKVFFFCFFFYRLYWKWACGDIIKGSKTLSEVIYNTSQDVMSPCEEDSWAEEMISGGTERKASNKDLH